MIVVDSSVWIGNLRNHQTAAVRRLRELEETEEIVVGDLVLLEVLQGARTTSEAARIERSLRRFSIEPMLGDGAAVRSARNYRTLRQVGVTTRKLADIVIATFCVDRGYELLQQDRDFTLMARHLGLRLA